MKTYAYLIYNDADTELRNQFIDALNGIGIESVFDIDMSVNGNYMRDAIDLCDVVICVSPRWSSSERCKSEFRYAHNKNKSIIIGETTETIIKTLEQCA